MRFIIFLIALWACVSTFAGETIVRHSSGVFMVTMPDGWGWRETPGPHPNGDGASPGGEALFQLIVAPAKNDDLDAQMKLYLPLVQNRWKEAAMSGQPRGTFVGRDKATICRLVFKDQGKLQELRTVFFIRHGNVIIGVMRTEPDLAARFEADLREILGTVRVKPVSPPPSAPPAEQPPALPASRGTGNKV